MTIETFNQKWGAQWSVLKRHPMFEDMLMVALLESPATKAHGMTLATMTEQTPAFTGTIAGYSYFMDLVKDKLGAPVTSDDEQGTFEQSIEEILSEDKPE